MQPHPFLFGLDRVLPRSHYQALFDEPDDPHDALSSLSAFPVAPPVAPPTPPLHEPDPSHAERENMNAAAFFATLSDLTKSRSAPSTMKPFATRFSVRASHTLVRRLPIAAAAAAAAGSYPQSITNQGNSTQGNAASVSLSSDEQAALDENRRQYAKLTAECRRVERCSNASCGLDTLIEDTRGGVVTCGACALVHSTMVVVEYAHKGAADFESLESVDEAIKEATQRSSKSGKGQGHKSSYGRTKQLLQRTVTQKARLEQMRADKETDDDAFVHYQRFKSHIEMTWRQSQCTDKPCDKIVSDAAGLLAKYADITNKIVPNCANAVYMHAAAVYVVVQNDHTGRAIYNIVHLATNIVMRNTKRPVTSLVVATNELKKHINLVYQAFGARLPTKYKTKDETRPDPFWDIVHVKLNTFMNDPRWPFSDEERVAALKCFHKLQSSQSSAVDRKQPFTVAGVIYFQVARAIRFKKMHGAGPGPSSQIKGTVALFQTITGVSAASLSQRRVQFFDSLPD